MNPMLRLCEDVLSNHAAIELPAHPRMIFVVHGSIAIADRTLRDDEAFGGECAIMLKAGSAGATVWRWELITREADFGPPGSGIISHEKLAAMLSTVPAGALLLRGDSVAFPPGGCAYLHRHQGPGIRCLIEGGIASTPMAAPPHTARAAPGMRPGLTVYSRKRPIARRVSSG